jgi:hypothetical protein
VKLYKATEKEMYVEEAELGGDDFERRKLGELCKYPKYSLGSFDCRLEE